MQDLIPRHIEEQESDSRGIKAGWYAMRPNGTTRVGPFANRDDCLVGIAGCEDEPAPRVIRPGVH